MTDEHTDWSGVDSDGLTRRTLLERGAQGAVLLSSAGMLAACGGSSSGSEEAALPTSTGTGDPIRGGSLSIGGISLGKQETLYPLTTLGVGVIRSFQLFDTLFLPDGEEQHKLLPRLALAAEPNKDASVWTVTLRDDVVWHDGKPFTADDVVFSINQWADPTGQAAGIAALIDLKQVRKRGRLVVEVPLLTPDALWPTGTAGFITPIMQNGSRPEEFDTNPIGTGPFSFVSFDPGRESVFKANPDYWEEGRPYLDEVVVNSSFADQNARVNALLSGEIDVMHQCPPQVAKDQRDGGNATVFGSPSAQPYVFIMRVDKGQFADLRVRQAFKMLVDRQALIDGALGGFGRPGTDLFGEGAEYFADELVPEHDVEKAKSLLKEAGVEGDTFTLQTSNVVPGFVEAPTLFAQQAQSAGINLEVQEEPSDTFYTAGGGFITSEFRHDYYLPIPSLPVMYSNILSDKSAINQSHWGEQPGGEAALALVEQARAETDPERAQELWTEVQTIQFNEGGNIIWANVDYVALAGTRVRGVTESRSGFLNNGRMSDAWLA